MASLPPMAFTPATTASAMWSQRAMPPKMFTKMDFTLRSAVCVKTTKPHESVVSLKSYHTLGNRES